MNVVSVTGIIVSRNGVTLFSGDGTSMVLQQSEWRTAAIISDVLPRIASTGGAVEVDLDAFTLKKQIESITGGVVSVNDDQSIVVNQQVIPTKGELKKHIERIAYGEGAIGFKLFMEDFAKIESKHSAKELLSFMEHNDLPIADDGSILVYKFLDAVGDGFFVDHHTGKVRQRIGSLVTMPLDRVNDDRRIECATGLHVCSAKYGSYGNAVLLAKVRPSDVIAVPHNEGGKMRVRAYHLVAQLSQETYEAVANKKSATEITGGRAVIADIIAGNHVGVLEEVKVFGSLADKPDTPIEVKAVEQPAKKPPRNKTRPLDQEQGVTVAKAKRIIAAAQSGDLVEALNAGTAAVEVSLQPWQSAKVGDFIQVDGSRHFKDGTYEVAEVLDDAVAARLQIVNSAGYQRSVPNTLVKRIVPKTEVVAERREAEYLVKFEEAKALIAKGQSLRVVAKELGMCRETLSKRLKTN